MQDMSGVCLLLTIFSIKSISRLSLFSLKKLKLTWPSATLKLVLYPEPHALFFVPCLVYLLGDWWTPET